MLALKYGNVCERDSRTYMGAGGLFRQKPQGGQIPAGTGRVIPLNPRAVAALTHWRGLFPGAQPEHYVFAHEKYGLAGNDRKRCAHGIVPTEPMQRWKVAREGARRTAKVCCRFHDLRHTFISRLAESQASNSTVMALAGHVSRAMMERYSHIRMEAKRRAVNDLSGTDFEPKCALSECLKLRVQSTGPR
jgi:integrase